MLSPIFCIRENKELLWIDSTGHGLMLKQEFPRDLFLDHHSFWSISIIYLVAWLQIQSYLRMIPLCSPLFKIFSVENSAKLIILCYILIKTSSSYKHLDTKLDFSFLLKNVQNKVNKTIGLLRKFQNTFLRTSSVTIYL